MVYHEICFDLQPRLDVGWESRYSDDGMPGESFERLVADREKWRGPARASPNRAPPRQRARLLNE